MPGWTRSPVPWRRIQGLPANVLDAFASLPVTYCDHFVTAVRRDFC